MVYGSFANRAAAGKALAEVLGTRAFAADPIVLALARGGVPVGFALAERLRLPLDVLVVRKLGVPWQPELAIGAIAGTACVLDEERIRQLGIFRLELAELIGLERAEMERRENLYRAGAPPLNVRGKSAVLIDDGLATGNTMRAAIRYVHTLEPAEVIVAVPVASQDACHQLRSEADDLLSVVIPLHFESVGEWYGDFQQVGDDEVQNLVARSRQSPSSC
jgi:predicted phosphoribosyltransferase